MRVLLSSLWTWLLVSSSFSSLAPRRPRVRRRAAPVRLGLELLEDRTVPSMVTVTSASDDPTDTGSLRYALNNATSGETIDFAASVRTIDLSSTLNIGVDVAITNDQGIGPVTIDGGGQFTVFTVPDNVTAALSGLTIADGNTTGSNGGAGGILNNGTLTVSNSTFSNNSVNDSESSGGGILNNSTLTVNNCTFSSNSVSSGGGAGILNNSTLTISNSTFSNNLGGDGSGIYNGGALTVNNSTFSNNHGGNGGGIFNYDTGTLTVGNSTFSSNSAINSGGGILNSGLLLVSNSTFSSNSAISRGGQGGGIYNGGQLLVSNSTFSSNSASSNGGGICSNGYTLTVSNSTFASNSASSGGGICIVGGQLLVSNSTFSSNSAISGGGEGGGIFNGIGDLLLGSNSTFASNSAQSGGGIFNGGTLTVSNSTFSANSVASGGDSGGGIASLSALTLDGDIVAGNVNTFSGATPDDIAGLAGATSSDNLIGTGGSGGLFDGQNGNQIGVGIANVGLGPLGENGGPTETLAIGPGSFALGKGVTETTATTDQRGVARPINEPSDVGAYQYSVADPFSVVPFSSAMQSATVASTFAPLEALVTDSSGNPVSGASVTFAAVAAPNGATGSFAGNATVTTNTHGVATAPPLTAGQTAGTFTVTASVSSVASPADFNLTSTPSIPATVTAVGGTPQNTPIGSAYGSFLQAKVVDAYGNPLANVPVTFAAPLAGPSGTFNALNFVPTNTLGIATAPGFSANHVLGNFTVTATVAGVASPANFGLTITAIPAAIKTVSGSGQHATVFTSYGKALAARVTDATGKPVSGITVAFELPASAANGTFAASPIVVTDANGVATAPALTANTMAGRFTINAWVVGVAAPASFTLTNTAGPPASVNLFSGNSQSAVVTKAYKNTLQVGVTDQFGNPVAGVKVTFTAPNSGPGGTFVGKLTATATANANGVAIAPAFTANAHPGGFTVIASISGAHTSFSLTNLVGPAAKIVAVSKTTPQTAKAGSPFAVNLGVVVTDSVGNAVPGVQVTFTIHANATNGASGTFGGSSTATATTNAVGVATAPQLTANAKKGTFTVVASIAGLTQASPFTLTVASIAGLIQTPIFTLRID